MLLGCLSLDCLVGPILGTLGGIYIGRKERCYAVYGLLRMELLGWDTWVQIRLEVVFAVFV